MTIRSLSETPFELVAHAFSGAFAQYEVQIDPEELRTMLRRRGFDPLLSFAAFDDNTGNIAAFTLNGIGIFGGEVTAYDTGTGTLPDYRGKGLAARIFETSLPHLKEAGVGQYLLEVLQHNEAAISVYRRLGFEVSREFNYFRATIGDVKNDHACTEVSVRPMAQEDLMRIAPQFWDFEPSWQNSLEAIRRASEDFIALGAFDSGKSGFISEGNGSRPIGYIVFDPMAGDITQIAVAKEHRQRGIGSALLGEMLRLNCAENIKCLNTEMGRDTSIAGFLRSKNIAHAGKQFEMRRKI
jgi:ribosomal protein S18 acetylase RimI-like enzyme